MNTIMILDDETNLLDLYQQELAKEYNIIPVCSSRDALQKMKSEKVNLVVLDLNVNNENGLDVIDQMLGYDRNVKIVINSEDLSHKWDFATWSADAYLQKSPDLKELRSTISKLLSS